MSQTSIARPTLLLLGKNGQLGWELQRALAPLGRLVALDRQEADLSQPETLREVVRAHQPDFIVNAAAYTAVDRAEQESDMARRINAESPLVLAQEAQALGAYLMHYSTDYVFDGSGDAPWTEEDAAAPLNVYGQTKWEGEQAIQNHCDKHIILRTSWVYAARGMNFAKTMRRLAREREELRVVSDQIGAPTGADLIADVSAHILRQTLMEKGFKHSGLYHLAATGFASWFDYAQFVVANSSGCIVKHLEAVPSSEYLTAAKRPLNSRVSTDKLKLRFGLTLPDWRIGVLRMLQETDDGQSTS